MLKEVSGMEKKILLSSCETDYNSDLHSWIDIERQIKNLADAGFYAYTMDAELGRRIFI